ncbi:MAG: hypothetical protein EA360_10190 [Balneolaceae bacterium]|nr:MAG: hypothetical protein EA360_10190 [Balneolaceae bacterium]
MKMIQNSIKYLILGMPFLALTAFGQSSSDAYRVETFSVSDSPRVEIRTSGGFIEVHGNDGDEVIVEMYVRYGNRYLKSDDTDLSNFEITIEKRGDRVVAEARSIRSRSGWFISGRTESISFRLYVPEGAEVEGRTSGGNVSARNISNKVYLSTSGGRVTATDLSGRAELKTSGGTLQLTDIDGVLNARTSGGSIAASGINGTAELNTSGGNITLEKISARMIARTSGGNIRAELSEFKENLELSTSGGNIVIRVPEQKHYNLDLRGQRVNTTLENFTGEFARNRIIGKVGDGGPLLSARTSGGSVSISN